MNKKVYIISTSTISSVKNKLKDWDTYFPNNTIIKDTPYDFYDEMEDYETPFPCNPYWDKKVFWWITKNTEKLRGNTLYWNIGS